MSPERDSWDDPIGAEIYAEVVREGRLYRALADELARSVQGCAGRVLDLATGSGIVTSALLAGGAEEVVGIDAAAAMLEVARREEPNERAAFLAADAGALPFPDASFAAATCSAAFWHLPAQARALAELRRVLRPGGRLALNVPAAQLRDAEDLPPAPLQLALAREGERRFGAGPQPAGPVRSRGETLALAEAAGLRLVADRFIDVSVDQRELLDLLAVPAIGARSYPDRDEADLEAWIAGAGERVELEEQVQVRWWFPSLEVD